MSPLKTRTEAGEEESPCRLSLAVPSRAANSLETWGTSGPCPGPCCHGPCGAAEGAGCRSPCSTCCTSLCTPSPTADSAPAPSGRDPRGWGPSTRRAPGPEGGASARRGCGSGSPRGSGSESETCRVPLLQAPPSRHRGTTGSTAASRSACTHRTVSESETWTWSVHSCVRYGGRTESAGTTGRGNGTWTGTGWESKSRTWTWTETWTWIWTGSTESG